jgi:hypothetical protein
LAGREYLGAGRLKELGIHYWGDDITEGSTSLREIGRYVDELTLTEL